LALLLQYFYLEQRGCLIFGRLNLHLDLMKILLLVLTHKRFLELFFPLASQKLSCSSLQALNFKLVL
jgi:hypothetical protein